MRLLNWDGISDLREGAHSLRDVVEDMRQVAALVEMIGVLFELEDHRDDYDFDTAQKFIAEAGHLGQALGKRALELLDAEATPEAPAPATTPRKYTTKPRAVRLCRQLAGLGKEGG